MPNKDVTLLQEAYKQVLVSESTPKKFKPKALAKPAKNPQALEKNEKDSKQVKKTLEKVQYTDNTPKLTNWTQDNKNKAMKDPYVLKENEDTFSNKKLYTLIDKNTKEIVNVGAENDSNPIYFFFNSPEELESSMGPIEQIASEFNAQVVAVNVSIDYDHSPNNTSDADHELHNKVVGRLTVLARKAGYSMEDIHSYIAELEGNFEPEGYRKMSDKDLLDDFKLFLAER
jgi:hypothetical protein